MDGFNMNDLQALTINRDDTNGSFRKKRELVSALENFVNFTFIFF
jgi:hypothetical protein